MAENEKHSHQVHILHKELFGMDYDDRAKKYIDQQEWTLLVSIGKLLTFYYKESGEIEKIAANLEPKDEASSSSSGNAV